MKEYFPSELSPQIIEHVRSVLTVLKANGASIVPVSMPSTSYALSSYYVLASAEASSNMARYDGIQYGEGLFHLSSDRSIYIISQVLMSNQYQARCF